MQDTGAGNARGRFAKKSLRNFAPQPNPTRLGTAAPDWGLPISKRFVELHHGQMGVESVLGEGTCFWFTLPMTSGATGFAPGHFQSEGAPSTGCSIKCTGKSCRGARHRPGRIASLLGRYLEGYQIIGATTWEEGVLLAEETKAIALVSDQTKQAPPQFVNLPVIHCPLPSNRLIAANFGADDFLLKPRLSTGFTGQPLTVCNNRYNAF